MDEKLIEWVRSNLTYNQSCELADIIGEIAKKSKSLTSHKLANSIIKAGTGG